MGRVGSIVVSATRVLGSLGCALVMAATLLCAASASALAADVTAWGAQTYTTSGQTAADEINLVYLQGASGDTVYLTVKDGDKPLVQYLPHTLDESGKQGDKAVDVFSIHLEGGIDEAKLKDGSYTVEVWTKRGGDKLFSGKVYGVWARLGSTGADGSEGGSGSEKLIGTRTLADGGAAFTFAAPNIVRDGGTAYQKSGGPEKKDYLAYYDYSPVDEDAPMAEVVYVDEDGNQIGLANGEATTFAEGSEYDIPATIDSSNGKRYRTLAYTNPVKASAPDQMAFTVQCVEIGGAAYVATIRMVDAADVDNLLATDTVTVNGAYNYSAPLTIYKYEEADGEMRAVAYDLVEAKDNPQVWELEVTKDFDSSLVVNGERTITVKYSKRSLDAGEIEVTFNQLDGQANTDVHGRLMGTQTETVTKDNPQVTPYESIDVDGVTYVLASSASDYAYSYDSGEIPVVDVYYVPEGYSAGGSYEVTVNYVNFANSAIIRSEVFTSSADPAVVGIDSPKRFDRGGATYIRLAGQTGLSHNFYSGMDTYTVYYRDSRDTLSDDVVIQRTRVVNGGAGEAGGAGANGATYVSINPAVGYNAVGGAGSGTLLNDRGQDTNTERITDDTTPLASADGTTVPSDEGGIAAGALAAGIVLAAGAVAAALWWFLVGRRRKNDENEA